MRSHSDWQPNPEQPSATVPFASRKRQVQCLRRTGVVISDALYLIVEGFAWEGKP